MVVVDYNSLLNGLSMSIYKIILQELYSHTFSEICESFSNVFSGMAISVPGDNAGFKTTASLETLIFSSFSTVAIANLLYSPSVIDTYTVTFVALNLERQSNILRIIEKKKMSSY